MKGFLSSRLRPFDYVFLVAALIFCVFSVLVVYVRPGESLTVRIEGDDHVWVFPLEAEERISVAGPLGTTEIEITGTRCGILSSPCANQTCVASGNIGRHGQWTACLPNKVFLLIEGRGNNHEIDAATW